MLEAGRRDLARVLGRRPCGRSQRPKGRPGWPWRRSMGLDVMRGDSRSADSSSRVATVAVPIMFDRTPANEIIIPGLWWRLMFEKVSEDVDAPDEMRQMADTIVTTTVCNDVLLPADSDTIEISTL